MTSRKTFLAALAGLLAAPLAFVACTDAPVAPLPTGGACGDPNLMSLPSCTGAAADHFSDEACTVFDDRITCGLTTDATRSASITTPTEMQSVPAATPFAFTWTTPVARWHHGPARWMTWREELARWTSLVPEAQAHCPPFTGRAYELSFKVNGVAVLRREQSATSWTPDTAAWGRLRAAAGSSVIELTVIAVTFDTNQISAGGPFVSGMLRHFTISG